MALESIITTNLAIGFTCFHLVVGLVVISWRM